VQTVRPLRAALAAPPVLLPAAGAVALLVAGYGLLGVLALALAGYNLASALFVDLERHRGSARFHALAAPSYVLFAGIPAALVLRGREADLLDVLGPGLLFAGAMSVVEWWGNRPGRP
jgi:hypothetical protein